MNAPLSSQLFGRRSFSLSLDKRRPGCWRRLLCCQLVGVGLVALPVACSTGGSNKGAASSVQDENAAVDGNANANLANGGAPAGANGNQATAANTPVQQPNGPAVQFLGRFDTTTDANYSIMSWPGSQILIGFAGTQLTVRLSGLDSASYGGVAQNAWVAARIDNGNDVPYKITSGEANYLVAQNLPQGQHTVRLTLRTEAQMGRVAFVQASTDGKLSYTPPVPVRRLEVVGDSGAAGYGADGTYPCSFSAATENAAVAYPMLLGSLLGAEVRDLSFSGKGLVQNRDMVNDGVKTLPVLWQRTLANDGAPPWDPNSWTPEGVVLITGGNDFYVDIPDANTYISTVRTFIGTLKGAYPGVKVFVAASPMLRDDSHPTQRETAIGYLKQLVAQAADANVRYLDVPGPDLNDANSVLGANGFGCDEHPSPATHRKVATSMAASLKAALGW